MDRELLKAEIIKAEKGDNTATQVVREVLRPLKTDSVEQILEKISIFIRLIFLASLKFEDAPFHIEIDKAYAEQIHSYLNTGKPKYKGLIIVGYRESAKTSRVKFNETYMTIYCGDILDYTSILSANGSSAAQFTMDMFNALAFSRISHYYPNLISLEQKKKKESQTMTKFTTLTGITYGATSSRQSNRGQVKMDIDDAGDVETKRPKKVIFDDIENETTIRSVLETQHIGSIIGATIDGLDQIVGSWILLGNYLSLRGNVAKFINKFRSDPSVLTILIPIIDGLGNPTWPGKYVRTDKEEAESAEKGLVRRSVESIQRTSENFNTEFLNNPKRSLVYFDDETIKGFDESILRPETERDEDGLLVIEEADARSTYVISADSGKGTGGDDSSFTVIKISGIRYEEVANFKSKKMRPEQFAPFLANIGRRYNNALIIPENNYPGNETIAFLIPIYKNIYVASVKTGEKGEEIKEYGIHTNLKTKPEMFLHAKKVFLDRLFTVRSSALYHQILEYPSDEVHVVKARDGSGGHFDLLMALMIGLWKASSISATKTEDDEAVDRRLRKLTNDIFKEQESTR